MSLGKMIAHRIVQSGDTSPGAYNLAADIVQMCVDESAGWTNRWDDAMRIPDVLGEAERELREAARTSA